MRLVIEREGGFVVVESDDVVAVDVLSNRVEVSTRDGKALTCEREGHAASVALATAIAARCGVMVELLAEQPEVDGEDVMHDATAALVREHSTPWKPASEWVDVESPRSLGQWVAGEPPKGGLWYVVARSGAFGCVAWDGIRWRDWYSETVLMGEGVAHLPVPLPSRR